jgi:hypothetical protein
MPGAGAPQGPGACIVSYPKMGRTWLRAMLGKYLCDRHGKDERNLTRTEPLTAACGLLRTRFMHGQAGFDLRLHWRELNPDRSAFRGRKVLLLSRDIRDTLVSAYFWATRRLRFYEGPISAFLRDDYFGAPKLLAYYRHWHDAREIPSALEILRYEELHRDPAGALSRVLGFLGAPPDDARLIEQAVAYASFDNLRRLEIARKRDLSFKMPEGAARPSGDAEGLKMRRGEVGRFADYLSPEDIAYVDELNIALGCEFTR